MKAIVLAGGFGTRLRDRVPHLPKPMAPVAGRPFLEYILDRLILGGTEEIILSVGYRSDIIISHFQKSYKNCSITYAIETEPLGTGGAIVHALGEFNDNSVLILNGDTLVNINYRYLITWYQNNPNSIALVLKEMEDVARYGSIVVNDGIISGFLEKGNFGHGMINAGVYLLPTKIFEQFGLSGNFSLEKDLLQNNCSELLPRAFITDNYFIDIGIPEDYERAQLELPNL